MTVSGSSGCPLRQESVAASLGSGSQRVLKAWLAYEGVPDWVHASFVCENGAIPYTHMCSHPCFVAGDLWAHRAERQRQMLAAGFVVEIQNNGEPIRASKLPPEVLERNKKNTEEIDAFYELLAEHKASA